ncbi:unnamed protein product [Chondrus crispus]|uniref:Transmembrane protein n=1 Tax=Chondrus crispus TaxID=2769 RepID=R7Q0P8_CHOCR|nr:unnamed protein product [Chondrus crispus]XP_005717809.1 unnamed protein product [Chondrus crispus]CDF32227.1 unnamed protein product [Chondrus crispus]CDF37940.1 unnamed protein product [Chondrus crispus]|eukprot:XP_005711892.1 unnamed protein product [Chondrus crispus]
MSLLKEKRQVLQAVQRLFDMLSRKGTTPTQGLMPRKHKARIVLAKWTVFLCLFCLCEARSFSRQLENVPLRCCAAVSYPTLYRDESKEVSVPFNSIVEKMDRCVTEEGTMREDPDCNCDMAVGGWMESDTRLGKVDFLPPFLIDGIGIATHVDETSVASAGAFFLTAFSLAVWGLVVMLSVVFTFLKMLDRRFVPPDDSYTPLPASEPRLRRIRHYLLKSRIPYRLRKALQSTLSRMVGFSNSDPVTDKESSRQWVLNLVIACCSLFIILAYESSMT